MVAMKNKQTESDEEASPNKRVKLEPSADDEALLLSVPASKGRKSRKGKTSSEERAHELLKDPRLTAVEPGQVLCRMCGNWIKLFKHTDYSAANWKVHADKCEIRSKWKLKLKEDPDSAYDIKVPEPKAPPPVLRLKEDDTDEVRECSPPPPSATPSKRNGKSSEERQQQLLDDPRAKQSEAHRVLCGMCNVWVRLHNVRRFDLYNWMRHAERCELKTGTVQGTSVAQSISQHNPVVSAKSGITRATVQKSDSASKIRLRPMRIIQSAPLPRVKTEPQEESLASDNAASSSDISVKKKKGRSSDERRQALEKDKRCGDVQPQQVFCLLCQKWVKLYKEVPYIDSNWTRHVEKCELRNSTPSEAPARTAGDAINSIAKAKEAEERGKKSLEKRKKELMDDNRITDLAPNEVRCGVCEKWITLNPKKEYDTRTWQQHIIACQQERKTSRDAAKSEVKPKTLLLHLYPIAKVIGEEDKEGEETLVEKMIIDSDSESVAIPAEVDQARERHQELLKDSRCEHIEPYRLFCKMCSSYVPLYAKEKFSVSSWKWHIENCSGSHKSTVTQAVTQSGEVVLAALPAEDLELRDSIVKPNSSAEMAFTMLSAPEERRKRLLDDPRVGGVEPNRVFCNICQRWLKLSNDFEYATFNWYKHIKRCEEKRQISDTKSSVKQSPVEDYSSFSPPMKRRLNVQERFEIMKADKRIKEMEPHRAQCGICSRWIKLQVRTEYDSHNWIAHISKCQIRPIKQDSDNEIRSLQDLHPNGPTQTSAVKSEDRLNQLRKDTRIDTIEPHRVLCGLCHQWIKLRDDSSYIAYNWHKHVGSCEKKHSSGASQQQQQQQGIVKKEPVTEEVHLFDFPSTVPVAEPPANQKREAFLRADPRIGGVERGRVFCAMCSSWIKLNTATGFLPGNWLRHAQRCQRKSNWQGETPLTPSTPLNVIDLSQPEDDETMGDAFGFIELGDLLDAFEPSCTSTSFATETLQSLRAASSNRSTPAKTFASISGLSTPVAVAGPASRMRANVTISSNSKKAFFDGVRRQNRSEESRRADLEADPRSRVVEKDRIMCNMCEKWIQMRHDVAFSPQNWIKHAELCEVRTGWKASNSLEERQNRQINSAHDLNEHEVPEEGFLAEQPLPYNATMAADAELPPPPSFTPVDWTVMTFTEQDDDSDSDEYDPASNAAHDTVMQEAESLTI